nr:MAG TPA: hypothetical protein [Caudoviricetes sp.]
MAYNSAYTGAQIDAAVGAVGNKLDKTGDASNVTGKFTVATTRTNIATGEKLSVFLGKIAKWFADLGTMAFKSSVAKSDLASDVQTSLGRADTALQSAPVTSVNGKTGAVKLSKSDVGLGSVDNVSINARLNRTTNVNAADTNYTTYMARGEALFSAETTPSVNGCIAWQYE